MSFVMTEFQDRAAFEARMEDIATKAAKTALSDLFEIFGVDITTKEGRKAIQDDFTWTRDARIGSRSLKTAGWVAAGGTLITGLLYAVWKGLAVLAALGGRV